MLTWLRSLPYRFLRRFPLPPWLFWIAAATVSTRFLAGVYGLIYDDEGRLLLCNHTYRARYPWGLPGGWMVRGESPLAAIEREVAEETGLRVAGERLLMVGVSRDRPKLEFVVRARLLGGQFRPSAEVREARWWPADGPLPIAPRQKDILAQAATLPPGEVGWYDSPWYDHPTGR